MPKCLMETREKLFILSHGFRGCNPWLFAVMFLGRTPWSWKTMIEKSCSLHGGEKIERQAGVRNETYPSICSN